jgi:hypothetical protein
LSLSFIKANSAIIFEWFSLADISRVILFFSMAACTESMLRPNCVNYCLFCLSWFSLLVYITLPSFMRFYKCSFYSLVMPAMSSVGWFNGPGLLGIRVL